MKYFSLPRVILLLGLCFSFAVSSAQCTVDPTAPPDTSGIYPDPLPVVPACKFADFDVTFVFPRDTLFNGIRIPFLEFEILNVSGLPNGMSWQCNLQPNCLYDLRGTNSSPDSVGCIRLFGTPTLPGTYPLSVDMNVEVPLVGQQPASYPALLVVGACERVGTCYDYVLSTTCAPASIDLTNNIASNGNTGFSYDWQITGPNSFNFQSTQENPPTVNFTDAGEYIINYTATVDTIGFVLDSIVIAGVNCSDDLGVGRPDLYWILQDPSGMDLINTQSTPITNANTPLTIGPLNRILQSSGTYTFEVWDEDSGLGGADDGCADGNNNGAADVSLNMATATTGVNAITNQGLTVNFHLSRPINVEMCADTIMVDSVPPVPTIATMGNTSICEGDSVELMISTMDSVQWYRDGQLLSGENGTTLLVKESGSYTAQVIDTMTQCRSISVSTDIDVVVLTAPSITLMGTLFSVDMPQAGVTYVWTLNGSPIGMGITLQAAGSGTYNAYVQDPGTGCTSDTSNSIVYTAVGIDPLAGLAQGIQLYPNPNNGRFTFEAELLQPSSVNIRVMDMLGREVLKINEQAQAGTLQKRIDMQQQQAGVYMLQLEIDGQSTIVKMVLQ